MESSICRSKSLPGKWKSNGLGVVISLMCVAADRPGGGGRWRKKSHNRKNTFRNISSFHQEISEHILVFSTQFSHASASISFVWGKQIDVEIAYVIVGNQAAGQWLGQVENSAFRNKGPQLLWLFWGDLNAAFKWVGYFTTSGCRCHRLL